MDLALSIAGARRYSVRDPDTRGVTDNFAGDSCWTIDGGCLTSILKLVESFGL